jgi:peptide deformylase
MLVSGPVRATRRAAHRTRMSAELHFDLTLYPDPVLRRPAAAVEAFDEELRAIVAGMFERMYASKGVGLAAPQVGLKKRILVLNPTGSPEDEHVLVNPRILERSGPLSTFEEGCLSFPGIYAEIERPEQCRVEAQRPDGTPFEETFGGFTSRVVQHEYDHLEGVLLVDRMSPADRLRHKAALDELVARFRKKAASVRR